MSTHTTRGAPEVRERNVIVAARDGHPDYALGHHPDLRARYAAFDRPLLALSFTDDDYAPAGSVEALLDFYSAAPIEHRRYAPEDLGGGRVGHFGFFLPRFRDSLWREVLGFIDGSRPLPRRRLSPCEP